jgi:general secretion pathway protein B
MARRLFRNWRASAECLATLFAACAACGPAMAQSVQRGSTDNTIPGGTIPSSTLSDAPAPQRRAAAGPIQAPAVVATPAPPPVAMRVPGGQVIAQPAPVGPATMGSNAMSAPQVQMLPQAPAAAVAPAQAPAPIPIPPRPPAVPPSAVPPQAAPRPPLPPAPAAQPVKGLPADAPRLVISGGTYSANPAERLVIVNGQVFGEGADLGSGVVLEQVKPESVVLGFRGSHYPVMY